MTFKEATDRLRKARVALVEVAEAFGVTPNTVSRWRSSAASVESRNALTPPADWPATIARLAQDRARRNADDNLRLEQLVHDLALADTLEAP